MVNKIIALLTEIRNNKFFTLVIDSFILRDARQSRIYAKYLKIPALYLESSSIPCLQLFIMSVVESEEK
jgi:hypothetical protein